MPAASKTVTTPAGGRKKSSKSNTVVTLKVSPENLRSIVDPQSSASAKEDTPSPSAAAAEASPAASNTLPATAPASQPENGVQPTTETGANTPADAGTPSQTTGINGAPVDDAAAATAPAAVPGPKKRGIKRGAGAANGDGASDVPKVRGKPGPKKRPRLEDGSLDPSAIVTGRQTGYGAAHKLGPKANMGAINAGLRALDRSGKPCRKWNKGEFRLKTFTGVVWGVSRWTAPVKTLPPQPGQQESSATETADASGAPSADSSSKENKESISNQLKSEASNAGPDQDPDTQSTPSMAANSPAPIAIAAA